MSVLLAIEYFNIFSAIIKILPNMLPLCLMLSGACYAKNYASIIGLGLYVLSNLGRSEVHNCSNVYMIMLAYL